jgi:formate-dependent nitrite reductase membrane component NrfD
VRPAPGPALTPANRGLGFPEANGEPVLPRRDAGEVPGYYDVPMLKPPVWKNSISWYFFLGGLSAGAYVTARLAERFGGEKFQPVATVGTCVAAAAVLPCAPLLIADLGDPMRFHHMLRVFKPESPMNLGAWTLTAYHGAGAAALAREWLRRGATDEGSRHQGFLRNAADGLLVAAADFAGIPLALLLASYTGVLLTGTATPVWCKNAWLPALFSASAMSSGAGAVSLALEALGAAGVEVGADAAREPLHALHTVAHLAEVVTLVGYLSTAGRPLTAGKLAPRAWGTLAAIAGSELLARLPASGARFRRWFDIGSAALGLFGAYRLRSTILKAGHESANDPRSRH